MVQYTEWKVGHDGFDTEYEITFGWIGVESVWQQFKKKMHTNITSAAATGWW